MSSDWPRTTFDQLCDIKRGASPRPIHDWLSPTGIPWVKISDATASSSPFINKTADFIRPEGAKKSVEVFPGDFILSNSATPGIPKFMQIHACVHDGWLLLRNFRGLDQWYCYYLLQIERENLIRQGNGSVFTNLKTEILKKHEVAVPPLDYQRKVATFLRSLDDRITLLRETNATLEAIAQALFKSWFVDFDPVRAKMEGRAPEGMDEAMAVLFPDSFEETELGAVPRGWAPVRLDSFIELAYGKALKAENRQPGPVPVYGSGGITGWHAQALVQQASVIVGRKGTVGSLYWESRPFFPIDTVFYVKSGRPLTYCYQLLKTLGLGNMNTDAAVPGLNRENVYRLLVPNAPDSVINAFDDVVAVLRSVADENEAKAQTLATLRDTLLPRLISGQLRLPEATETIDEALA